MSSIWTVRRSATDHKVSGLCGGIAQQWGVDPVLVRVGCVLLALSGGIGVVLYVAGWLMLPLEGQTRSTLDDVWPQAARWPRELKVVIVVIACVVGAVLLASVLPFGFGSALILAAIWYFGYYKNRRTGSDRGGFGPGNPADPTGSSANDQTAGLEGPQLQFFDFGDRSSPFTDAATAWQQRIREHQRATGQTPDPARDRYAATPSTGPSIGSSTATGSAPSTGPRPWARVSPPVAEARPSDHDAFLATPDPAGLYEPSVPATTPRPPSRALSKPARRLRLVSLLVLGLTMSGLGVASAMGAHVGLTTYLASALLVAGLTLVAAAWLGRARGILPVALLLALATTFSAVGGTGLDRPGVGVHSLTYQTSAAMPPADSWQSGSMTIDLSDLTVTASRSYDVHVDQGRLKIIVSPQTRVAIVSSVQDGYLHVAGEGTWGSDLTKTLPYTGSDPSGPVLTVKASVDQGVVEVEQR